MNEITTDVTEEYVADMLCVDSWLYFPYTCICVSCVS